MDPVLREYLDKLSERLLKSHEETRSDLKALKTMFQGQTRKLDELSDPKSGVKELEITHDNVAGDLTPAEETTDIVPDLAASAVSAKPLEIDASGIDAPTPTSCSTDGCNHNEGGDDPMAACQAAWSTPPSFTVPPGDSPTLSSEPAPGLTLGALAHTKYSTEGSEVSFNSIVLVSMSGAARSATVTTLSTAASQGVIPTVALTTPHTNYSGLGLELRPLPWPSFDCFHRGMHLKHLGLLRQSTYVMAHFVDYLNSLRNSWRYLPSVQLKQCPSEKVDYWIPMVPKDTSVPGQQIMRLMDVHLKLPWLTISCKCRTVHVWSELLHGELSDEYYSSVTNSGSLVTISVGDLDSLKFMETHFLVVHEQVRDLVSYFCLEKLWGTRDPLYKKQEQSNFYELHVLEPAVVCSIPRPDKLQGTILIMNMSVQWQFLSREAFKGSGRCAKQGIAQSCWRVGKQTVGTALGKFCGCLSELQLATSGIEIVTLNRIIANRNHCTSWESKKLKMKCTDKSSYEIKTGLCSLRPRTSRTWMVFPVEWPLSSGREFLVGAKIISMAVTCTVKLCSASGVVFSSYSGPLKSSSNCEQPQNLESSDATTLTPPVEFQSSYSVGMMSLSFMCDILHSFSNEVARNSVDIRSIILVAWLQVLRFLSHVSSEPDGMTCSCTVVNSHIFPELRLFYFTLPGMGRCWIYVQLIGATEVFHFPSPSAVLANSHDKCILILVEIEHKILFLGKGCLKCHMVHSKSDSKMLQPSGIQCVQPTDYFEVGSVPAYLKLNEVRAAFVYMLEQRTIQSWVLLLCFNHQPPRVYFGMVDSSLVSLCVPAILVEDSVQHWVIHIVSSIQDGGDQYTCKWSALCLCGKWVMGSGTRQNVQVYVPLETVDQHEWFSGIMRSIWIPSCLDWKFNLHSYWYGGISIESGTLAVCQAMPCELMLFLDRRLDISRPQLHDCNNCCLLFCLSYYYLLLSAIAMLEFDLYIYQRVMSWDPGGPTLLLLLEFTRRAAFQGGRSSTTTAWGQAVFQGGRGVSDLPTTRPSSST